MTSRIESGMLRVNMQVRRSRARDAIGDGARGSEERTRNGGIRRLLCMCRRVVGKEIGWVGCLFGNVYTGDWIGLGEGILDLGRQCDDDAPRGHHLNRAMVALVFFQSITTASNNMES